MAKPPPRRPGPTQQAPADDDFSEKALALSVWAQKNARILIAVAVLVVVGLGAFLYYRSYRADLHERAAIEYMQMEQTIAAANPPIAIRELEDYIDRYDGTPYAREGRVTLARLHLEEGNTQAAIDVLEGTRRRVGRSALDAQAELLLGGAYAAEGEVDSAIDSYLNVGRDARYEYQREEGLSSAALLREETGDYGAAADLYAELAEMHPEGSSERALWEMRRAEAEARGIS